MSKYDPLGTYLEAIPERTNRWRASFGDIEKILGFPLPKSARTYQAWWANEERSLHPQKAVWLDNGWRTEELDLGSEKVTFYRDGSARKRDSRPRFRTEQRKPKPSNISAPEVSSPWSWDKPETVHCKAGFSWRPVGRVLVDAKGKLHFPSVEAEPGIYRLRLKSDRRTRDYIGESDNLRRRFQNYRHGPEGQQTSFRIHKELLRALEEDTEISVAIMEAAVCQPAGAAVDYQTDLSRKVVRCLFENLALALLGAEEIDILNRHGAKPTPKHALS